MSLKIISDQGTLPESLSPYCCIGVQGRSAWIQISSLILLLKKYIIARLSMVISNKPSYLKYLIVNYTLNGDYAEWHNFIYCLQRGSLIALDINRNFIMNVD
jgi:hypothetical protein